MSGLRVHATWLRCESRVGDALRSRLDRLEQRCDVTFKGEPGARVRHAEGWLRISGELARHAGPRTCALYWGRQVRLVAATALGLQGHGSLTGNLLMLARNEIADPQIRAAFEHAWEIGAEQAGVELLLAHELLRGNAKAVWLCALPFATVLAAVQAMEGWEGAGGRSFSVMRGIFRHG